jgi:hypothetical protein
MKILKIALYSLLGILALLLIVAIFVNKNYAISREITISKPVEVVFNYVKYLKNQENYSVWSKIDPAMKKEYRGTDGSVGFVSAWDSKVKDAGRGEQEIIKITENERIDCELRFIWPMESKDHIFMITKSVNDDITIVRWGFEGKMEYPMNLVLLFMNFDAMVGPDLEKGLANLKDILEK